MTIPTDLSPLWISLKVSLLALVFIFFMGVSAAYWMLGYHGRWRSLLEGVLISPLVLPPTVVGFILLIVLGNNGPIGKLLMSFDLSIVFTWYGAAISATLVAFPLMYRTVLGAFEQIDNNLIEVARSLGASEWKIFYRVMMPMAFPGVIAGVVLSFARALGEFGATLMLAGNIPGQTQTMPMAIYFAVEAGSVGEAWFWSIVIIVTSLTGVVTIQDWQNRRQKSVSDFTSTIEPRGSAAKAFLEEATAEPLRGTGLFVTIQKYFVNFNLDLTCQLVHNSTLGILGGSGAGKTMLLRCIAGLERPTHGQIILNGQVLFDSETGKNVPSRDRRVGYVPQNYALFPNMTVSQNIAFGIPPSPSVINVDQLIQSQLEDLYLRGYGDRYPHQLSGGEQQRVALARAIVSQPEILLLDEPFSALDTYLRNQIEQTTISTVRHFQGLSVLVSHNLDEIYQTCGNILVLDQGKVVANGSKHEVFEHPARLKVAQLTGCQNISPIEIVNPHQILAIDWGIQLQVNQPLTNCWAYVGIHAHQIQFVEDPNQVNTFPCWLVSTSETPYGITLFLRFQSQLPVFQNYHVQLELLKDTWETMKQNLFPWLIQLQPRGLILLEH